MSAIASLYNVPSTEDEFHSWSFAHAAHHRDILRRLRALGVTNLDEFVLDPFNIDDAGVWTYQHQVMHQQMDGPLGIAGFDLIDIDFKDSNQFSGWVWLNGQEHYQAANLLGIG